MSKVKTNTPDSIEYVPPSEPAGGEPVRLRQGWSKSIVDNARGTGQAPVPNVRSTAALRARAGEQFHPPAPEPPKLPELPVPQEAAGKPPEAVLTLRERVSSLMNLFSNVAGTPEE